MSPLKPEERDEEIELMHAIFEGLLPLSGPARKRVLNWVVDKLEDCPPLSADDE